MEAFILRISDSVFLFVSGLPKKFPLKQLHSVEDKWRYRFLEQLICFRESIC